MAEMGLRTRVLVKDVMTSPVITVDEESSVSEVARLMEKHNVGCIIVTDKMEKPVGIITERDLVVRILAKNLQPTDLTAKDVMTTPLITVDPDETISEAARRMSHLNIRRLGVVYKGKLVGIISSKDIIAVTPEIMEIMQERARLESEIAVEESAESPPMAGYCDRCGQWSSNLKECEGSFLCEECQAELRSKY